MSIIQIPKKIRAEDFKDEDRDMASKIGAIYNEWVDNLYFLLQKKLDFNNLNRQVVDIVVTLDGSGNVSNPPTVRLSLTSKPKLVYCGNAVCLTNNLSSPTGQPFVTWALNNNTLVIQKVTNLQANSQYQLSLEIIGE
jgi:hypothetical protein